MSSLQWKSKKSWQQTAHSHTHTLHMNDTPGSTTGRCNYIYVQCPEHRFLHLFTLSRSMETETKRKGCNYLRNMNAVLALSSTPRLKEKLKKKKKGTIMLLYRTNTTDTPPPVPHSCSQRRCSQSGRRSLNYFATNFMFTSIFNPR